MEFSADTDEEASQRAKRFVEAVCERGGHAGVKHYDDPAQVAQVWEIREGGVTSSKLPGEHPGWPSWEAAAVAPQDCGDYTACEIH